MNLQRTLVAILFVVSELLVRTLTLEHRNSLSPSSYASHVIKSAPLLAAPILSSSFTNNVIYSTLSTTAPKSIISKNSDIEDSTVVQFTTSPASYNQWKSQSIVPTDAEAKTSSNLLKLLQTTSETSTVLLVTSTQKPLFPSPQKSSTSQRRMTPDIQTSVTTTNSNPTLKSQTLDAVTVPFIIEQSSTLLSEPSSSSSTSKVHLQPQSLHTITTPSIPEPSLSFFLKTYISNSKDFLQPQSVDTTTLSSVPEQSSTILIPPLKLDKATPSISEQSSSFSLITSSLLSQENETARIEGVTTSFVMSSYKVKSSVNTNYDHQSSQNINQVSSTYILDKMKSEQHQISYVTYPSLSFPVVKAPYTSTKNITVSAVSSNADVSSSYTTVLASKDFSINISNHLVQRSTVLSTISELLQSESINLDENSVPSAKIKLPRSTEKLKFGMKVSPSQNVTILPSSLSTFSKSTYEVLLSTMKLSFQQTETQTSKMHTDANIGVSPSIRYPEQRSKVKSSSIKDQSIEVVQVIPTSSFTGTDYTTVKWARTINSSSMILNIVPKTSIMSAVDHDSGTFSTTATPRRMKLTTKIESSAYILVVPPTDVTAQSKPITQSKPKSAYHQPIHESSIKTEAAKSTPYKQSTSTTKFKGKFSSNQRQFSSFLSRPNYSALHSSHSTKVNQVIVSMPIKRAPPKASTSNDRQLSSSPTDELHTAVSQVRLIANLKVSLRVHDNIKVSPSLPISPIFTTTNLQQKVFDSTTPSSTEKNNTAVIVGLVLGTIMIVLVLLILLTLRCNGIRGFLARVKDASVQEELPLKEDIAVHEEDLIDDGIPSGNQACIENEGPKQNSNHLIETGNIERESLLRE